MKKNMKFCIVTNIPAPYRIPIYNLLAEEFGSNFLVIYCAHSESNRKWNLEGFNFNHLFLKENVTEKKDGRFIHNNPDVWKQLKSFNPDAVITTGFNPTFLYSWLYCLLHGKKHIPMTDGWIASEAGLSALHRIVRKCVYSTSRAFICAGKNGFDLYSAYGIKREKMFQSHLCIDNNRFSSKPFSERNYDLMFSGQFISRKLPLFFADVAAEVKKSRPNLKTLIIGGGPQEKEFLERLDAAGVDYDYRGFVSQQDLPAVYNDTRLFLFPTRLDPWGIVANEAMASGVPVITTEYAGIINDLLIDGENGLVLDIDKELWAKQIIDLLDNRELFDRMSKKALENVKKFNFSAAAGGIKEAVCYALKRK